MIEGEEYDTPHHHHKSDENDLDDYEEEEKLHTQIRSGELGEMLQEAHLDHRIQMNFEDKNGEDEALEGEEEEEEEGQTPRLTSTDGQTQQRRDRGGRGRRGRGDRGGERGGHRPRTRPAVSALGADLGPADHQRSVEARARDPGSDCEGAHCQERRSHHQSYRASGSVPCVHADGDACWREPQDRIGRRTPAVEADSDSRARRGLRRIYRSHCGRGRIGRGVARRSSLPDSPVERDQAALRSVRSRRR